MNAYLVFMPEGDSQVREVFGENHYRLASGLWVGASDISTSVDVCDRLGIEQGHSMVVVPIGEYYGRFDRALWQRLDSWMKA